MRWEGKGCRAPETRPRAGAAAWCPSPGYSPAVKSASARVSVAVAGVDIAAEPSSLPQRRVSVTTRGSDLVETARLPPPCVPFFFSFFSLFHLRLVDCRSRRPGSLTLSRSQPAPSSARPLCLSPLPMTALEIRAKSGGAVTRTNDDEWVNVDTSRFAGCRLEYRPKASRQAGCINTSLILV